MRPPELEAQLRVAAVDHLVLEPEFRGRDYVADLESIGSLPATPQSQITRDEVAALERDASAGAVSDEFVDALDQAVRPADDLVIVFTSGSRGTPKGVIHTHGGALGATQAGLAIRGLERGDRLYIPMPFFWVGGLGTGLLSTLVAGATLDHGTTTRTGIDASPPRTRAGDVVPRLAGPSRRASPPIRTSRAPTSRP